MPVTGPLLDETRPNITFVNRNSMAELKTKVLIITKDFKIEGEIDLVPGARLTDFMNETNRFMVVSGATVSHHNDKEVLQGEFINVLVQNIEIILPADKVL